MVGIKIRVMTVVAITGPPAGVDGQLRQVGEPVSDQVRIDPGRGAAHQGAKRIEICRSRPLGFQVRVEEGMVSDFVIGIVVDVYGHVFVKYLDGLRVGFVSGSSGNFVILDTAEFVVLDPKVGLEYFCRRCKSEKGSVSGCSTPASLCRSEARQ